MQFIQIMEGVTFVVTLLMFACGIPPCLQMYRTKNTKNVPYIFFLLAAVACSGMFSYGRMLGFTNLIVINAVGATLNWIYVILYLIVVHSMVKPLLFLSGALCYMSILYLYFNTAEYMGLSSSFINTFLQTLPALELYGNIKNKHADGMPLIMLLGGICCGTSWLIYGLLLQDPNLYGPNIPGVTIVLAKLTVMYKYSTPKAKIA